MVRLKLYMASAFNLGSNRLSGAIPTDIAALTALESLALAPNLFSGTIPMTLTSCTKLYYFFISASNGDGDTRGLSGSIPRGIAKMTHLEFVGIWGASISGTIPPIDSLTMLNRVILFDNQLEGRLSLPSNPMDVVIVHNNR